MIFVNMKNKMFKATVSRDEYRKLTSEIALLKAAVLNLAKDELRPEVLKRLESRSKSIEAGKGIRITTKKELKKFWNSL